jgi:ligand-binding sensor domain-containing protein
MDVAGHSYRSWRVDAYNLDGQLLEQVWFAPGVGIARKAMYSADVELVLTDFHLTPQSHAAGLTVEADDARSEVGIGFFPTGSRVPFTLEGVMPEPVMVSAIAPPPEMPLARMTILQPGEKTNVRFRRRWSRNGLDPEAPQELSRCPVTGIHATASGAVWLGTLGRGLILWDGRLWARFDRRNSLADDYISAIAEDGAGCVWVGTQGRGLACLERREDCWTWRLHHKENSALRDDFITALLPRPEGLWIGTEMGALTLLDSEGTHHVPLPESCSDQRVTGLSTTGDGLLVGTDDGIWEWSEGTWRAVEGSNHHRVRGLGALANGSLLWGTYHGGAFLRENGVVRSLHQENGALINDNVWCVYPDGANRWLGTGRGAAFLEAEEEPVTYGVDSVTCIARVGAEIWLGTNVGLQILKRWAPEEGA